MIKELIEGVVDAGVELIESAAPIVRKKSIAGDRLEGGCAEWSVDAMEEFQEQDADPETLRSEAVALGLGDFDDQALGTQLGQVVAQLTQTIRRGGEAKGLGGALVQVTCPETSATAEMDEACERLHDGQQAGIVELQAGCPASTRGDGRLPQAG